jgi:hypothetical protein
VTQSEMLQAIMAGNEVALQWYAVTHGQQLPAAPGSVSVYRPPGGTGWSASFGSGTLVIGALVIIGLVIVFKGK